MLLFVSGSYYIDSYLEGNKDEIFLFLNGMECILIRRLLICLRFFYNDYDLSLIFLII